VRHISAALKEVYDSRRRIPAYKIYAWNPDTTTISAVVSAPSNHHWSIPEPLDLTPYATEINWTDKQLTFTIVDPGGYFHPDTGYYRNYLKDSAIIRLVEGDATVNEEAWIITFTGQIHGQVGWRKSRATGNVQSRITVFNRGETQALLKA